MITWTVLVDLMKINYQSEKNFYSILKDSDIRKDD